MRRNAYAPGRPWLLGIAAVIIASCLLSGCYTPKQIRSKAKDRPDPRRQEAEKLWEACEQVVGEKQWPVDIRRREDLLITTDWLMVGEDLRKRIRFLVLVTPVSVGVNVAVIFERRSADKAPPLWEEATDPKLRRRGRAEEERLVRRVHALWRKTQ